METNNQDKFKVPAYAQVLTCLGASAILGISLYLGQLISARILAEALLKSTEIIIESTK